MEYQAALKIVQKFADTYTKGDLAEAINQMDMARDCLRPKEKEAFYIIRDFKKGQNENQSC